MNAVLEAVAQRCSVKKVFTSFIKKETMTQVFSCKFCEISKNTFFHRTPLVAASSVYRVTLLFTQLIPKNAQIYPVKHVDLVWSFYWTVNVSKTSFSPYGFSEWNQLNSETRNASPFIKFRKSTFEIEGCPLPALIYKIFIE